MSTSIVGQTSQLSIPPTYDLPYPDVSILEEKAHDASRNLFSPGRFDVRVIDIDFKSDGIPQSSTVQFLDGQDFQHVLDHVADPRIRIISLYASGGPLPIRINESLMLKLMERFDVDSDFWHILLSFGSAPLPSECGSTGFFHNRAARSPGETLGYRLQHVEENGRHPPAMPWSARQTGVYHYRTPSSDFWLIIHQEKAGRFEKELMRLVEPSAEAQVRCMRLLEDPLFLHQTLFSLHVDTWRWHLRYLSKELDNRSNRAFTQTKPSDSVLGFDEVRELRRIYDQCIESHALCEGNNILLRNMQQASSTYAIPKSRSSKLALHDAWYNSALERQRGYLQGFGTLAKKLTNTIDLSAYAIDCEYQRTTSNVNWNVLRLTIVSLIYLPASFVATLFGANFFAFDTDKNGLIMGNNVWVLAVSWLLLTSFTFALYALMLWWRQRRAEKHDVALRKDIEKQGLLRRFTSERGGLTRMGTAGSTFSIAMRRLTRVSTP